jgi:deoxyadenosine/deoxycytidine kinase
MSAKKIVIGIVGPCAAGKSTLVRRLKNESYDIRHIAQEHSYVPYMWKRISNPHLLIYLDVSYENTLQRKQLNWTHDEYMEQVDRLKHAHQHADLIIDTNGITEEEVCNIAKNYIEKFIAEIDTRKK